MCRFSSKCKVRRPMRMHQNLTKKKRRRLSLAQLRWMFGSHKKVQDDSKILWRNYDSRLSKQRRPLSFLNILLKSLTKKNEMSKTSLKHMIMPLCGFLIKLLQGLKKNQWDRFMFITKICEKLYNENKKRVGLLKLDHRQPLSLLLDKQVQTPYDQFKVLEVVLLIMKNHPILKLGSYSLLWLRKKKQKWVLKKFCAISK